MLQYKEPLSKRNKAETGIRYEWYALQRWGAKYWDDFSKPKIVYREISIEMEAAIVPENWMINNKLYMITSSEPKNLGYICAFLNSKLFSKIILTAVNFGGGKGVDFLGNIKLPQLILDDLKYDNPFFYSIYGLSKEEIKFIESL